MILHFPKLGGRSDGDMETRPPAELFRLRFPISLPGGTIDRLHIDFSRSARIDSADDVALIALIAGGQPSILQEMAEHDYLRLLLRIDALNRPLVAMAESR